MKKVFFQIVLKGIAIVFFLGWFGVKITDQTFLDFFVGTFIFLALIDVSYKFND